MKILQLGKAYPPVNLGGIEVVIQNLHEGLNKINIHCDALGVNDSFKVKEEKGLNGGKIFRAKRLFKLFSTLFSINQIFILNKIKNNYDIIHIHSPDPMATFSLFITNPKCKIVLHWHSDIIKQKILLYFYSPLLKWLINKADIIITTSPIYAPNSNFLYKHLYKVISVPLGSDINCDSLDKDFYNKLRNDFFNKKILLSIGRLSYYKGYNYLIDAMNNLDDSYVLLIMGDGDLMNDLKSKIIKQNLTNKVFLLGSLNNLKKNSLYKVCDIFILSSFYKTEAFGIVQIEAMAFGKPVISTNIYGSGVSWVNKNNNTGIIVPIKDSLAISKAILEIAENKFLYTKYSIGSFDRFNEYFKLELMINKTISIYRNLLQ